jgi:hypothetical protein
MDIHRIRPALWLSAGMCVAMCLPLSAASIPGGTDCNRSCLLDIASAYMDSLAANDPSGVPFANHVRSTENGQPTELTAGLWASARGWRYRHTFVDPVSGSIGALGVVSEGTDQDAMLGLRLKVESHKIVESELLVTRKGDFSLFQPRAATEPRAVFNDPIAKQRRATRAELAEIPRHYFDAIREGNPDLVPVHPDANRVENGVQTTNNADFGASTSLHEGLRRLIYMHTARALRVPVIDPDNGLALAIVAVDMPEMTRTLLIRGKPVEINPERQHLPRTLFLFELFKVEDGQIREIEAVMRNMTLGADMGWPVAAAH